MQTIACKGSLLWTVVMAKRSGIEHGYLGEEREQAGVLLRLGTVGSRVVADDHHEPAGKGC